MSRDPRLMTLVIAAALVLLGAAAAVEVTIPRPDLSSMEPAAQRKIQTLQQALEELLQREDAAVPPLVEGFGLLGQFFHAFGLLDAAEICYSDALSLVPDDPRWSYLRGLVRNARGELDKAVVDYQRAVAAQPDVVPFRIRLGNAMLELGRQEEAGQHFQHALQVSPESAAALYGLGLVAVAAGETEEAVDYFERALELQPDATVIHLPLAQAYRRLRNMEMAQRHLEQRGEREVRFPDRLASSIPKIAKSTALEVIADLAVEEGFSERDFLGFVLSQFGQVSGAAEQLQQLLAHLESSGKASDLQLGRVHYAVGALLVAADRDAEAVAELEKAVRLAPELEDARLKLANALARTGRFADAVGQFDQLLAKQPENLEALSQRAAAQGNAGNLAAARSDLERAVQLEPEKVELHTRLASVLERLGEQDAAVQSYQTALGLLPPGPERASLYVAQAEMFRRSDDFQAAVLHYQEALEVDAENAPALSGLASLLGGLGYLREAAMLYARLVGAQPDNPAARLAEATALILQGEHGRARDRLEAGLEALPESLDLKDLLARHLAACPDRSVRDGPRALALALELYRAVPSSESIETVAMAHAEIGQYDKAVEWQEKLLAQAGDEADGARVLRWKQNLTLYREGKACCAEPGS